MYAAARMEASRPPPPSLAGAFALIPDRRDRRGRPHPPVALLCLSTVALPAGCRSLRAIAQFGRGRGLGSAHAVGFRTARTPAASTFGEPFQAVKVVTADAVFTHRGVCDTRTDAGGDDLPRVKDNQDRSYAVGWRMFSICDGEFGPAPHYCEAGMNSQSQI